MITYFHLICCKPQKKLLFNCNDLSKSWDQVGGSYHTCLVNGILGHLLKEHFPGIGLHVGMYELAWHWEHYHSKADMEDPLGRVYDNKAEQVKAELWVRLHYSIHYIQCTFLNSGQIDNGGI